MKQEQLVLIRDVYMEHYLSVIEMEYNGLAVDVNQIKQKMVYLKPQIDETTTALNAIVQSTDWPKDLEMDWNSSQQISMLLFGGEIKKDIIEPILGEDGEPLLFSAKAKKAGEIRTRHRIEVRKVRGLALPIDATSAAKAKGIYKTGDEVLQKLGAVPAAVLLLQYRKLTKQYQFYEKYQGLINPWTNCIHGEYHTCPRYQVGEDGKPTPPTGRMAADHPNLQQVPKEDVGEVFVSRFGNSGRLVCFDFSQLEVYIQAFITKCPQLRKDLNDGFDQHCLHAALAMNIPYETFMQIYKDPNHPRHEEFKQKRFHPGKSITFALQYGARAKKIAEQSHLPLATCQRILSDKQRRYPEVAEYLTLSKYHINQTERPSSIVASIYNKTTKEIEKRADIKVESGWWQTLTGKRYVFHKMYMITAADGLWSYYREPNILNYPIQGTATDIVNMVIGRLFRFLQNHRDKILIINETHDDIKFDCKGEYLEFFLQEIKTRLMDADKIFEELYGFPVDIGLKVDYDIGKTWLELKK